MSRSYAIQLVGAYAAIIGSAHAAQPLHIAFVQDRAICTIIDSAPTNCFGAVNVQISLPVWSRDGTKIAYIENTNSAQALATLVIVDKFGQGLSRTAIKPLPNGEVRSGMRFVESVEWIGPEQVAVSGSVNPSTTE